MGRGSSISESGKKKGRFDGVSYTALFEASGLFENDYYAYDDAWLEAHRGVRWDNLWELSVDVIIAKVIGFLNKWKCRLPYSRSLATSIKEAHKECVPFLSVLRNETIEDWDPDKVTEVNGKSSTNSEILLRVFSRFVTIGEHFSHVAASKVLHFLEPKLVVMWDNTIARHYRVPMTARNYVYRFVPLMKRLANEAIESYMIEKNCSREKAILALNQFRTPKTIAKLLDEYNYMRLTRRVTIKETGPTAKPLSVGDQLVIRAVKGRDGRVISRAEDGRVILFDNADPKSLLIKPGNTLKTKIVGVAEKYLIARLVEFSTQEQTRKETVSKLDDLFNEFKQLRNFVSGAGIIETDIHSWMEERRKSKAYYRRMFKPENLGSMTPEDFSSFLYFGNNRAWTTLYRRGLELIRNIDKLRIAIAHLQDNSLDIAVRMRDVLRGGRLHLDGFGKNIASSILHICDTKDQYGVWNRRTEEGLAKLNRKPPIPQDRGVAYVRINNSLLKLKNELDVDLVMLDSLLWYVSKFC